MMNARWRFLRQFFHPANLRVLEGFQSALRERPVRDAARWMLEACRIETVVDSGALPARGPLVIIMNSSTPMGGISVVANIDRTDLYMLGTVNQVAEALNHSEARLFPLYLSGQPNRNRWARFRNNVVQRRLEGMDRGEAALRNVASLRRAAQRVDQGNCLLIAPMGGTFFYKKDWKSGVGALVNSIRNPDTQIAFVRLFGGRNAHLLRLLNPYVFWPYRRREQIRLQIHPPVPIAELQRGGADAEDTSERIKQRYIEICGAL